MPKRKNRPNVALKGLWQVTALERWVEVKSNPDEVLPAWCRHREARKVLAAWRGYIGYDRSADERFWFPADVFEQFDKGVTFVTAAGCSSVVQYGSHIPRCLLTTVPLLFRLVQFALDRLKLPCAMDVD